MKYLYDLQKNVVIVCGEGIVDEHGQVLGAVSRSVDPAGNVTLSGAADALRARLIDMLGDRYFQLYRRGSSANGSGPLLSSPTDTARSFGLSSSR